VEHVSAADDCADQPWVELAVSGKTAPTSFSFSLRPFHAGAVLEEVSHTLTDKQCWRSRCAVPADQRAITTKELVPGLPARVELTSSPNFDTSTEKGQPDRRLDVHSDTTIALLTEGWSLDSFDVKKKSNATAAPDQQ